LTAVITGSIRKIKGVIGISVVSGLTFAGGQTLTVIIAGPELAAVIGSLLSLAVITIWLKLRPVINPWYFDQNKIKNSDHDENTSAVDLIHGLKAWSPYLLVLIIIIMTRFIPLLKFLDKFPFTLKQQFFFGNGGKEMTFQLLIGGGTILFISALAGGLIQGITIKKLFSVFTKTIFQVKKTVITVISIVIVAKLMGYSGMINSIAFAFSSITGIFYPLIAPMIGALGTFITGSDTSSNVLFGNLQKQTAIQLGINQEWLTAANGSGATAGKMISPQSISIAAAATGQTGKEGTILRSTIIYCLIYSALMGILVFFIKF
jgi:lactate permease